MNLSKYRMPIFWVFRFVDRRSLFFSLRISGRIYFLSFSQRSPLRNIIITVTGIMKLRFCWSTGKSVYSLLADYGVGPGGFVIIHSQFLYQVNDFFRMKLHILEDEIISY